jgi:regulator of replication initiation timing
MADFLDLWQPSLMAKNEPTSEDLRRDAAELRATAKRLMEEAKKLALKSEELEKRIAARTKKPA